MIGVLHRRLLMIVAELGDDRVDFLVRRIDYDRLLGRCRHGSAVQMD